MPLLPGTKLGQYEVVESIGAGGMERFLEREIPNWEKMSPSRFFPEHLRRSGE